LKLGEEVLNNNRQLLRGINFSVPLVIMIRQEITTREIILILKRIRKNFKKRETSDGKIQYDMKRLALYYLKSIQKQTEQESIDKQIKATTQLMARYMTIINHLEDLPKTWDYLKGHHSNEELSQNEINYPDFRLLDDDQCLYVLKQRFENKKGKKARSYIEKLVSLALRRQSFIASNDPKVIQLKSKYPDILQEVSNGVWDMFVKIQSPSMVAASIEKKKHLAIAKRCLNKYIIRGVSTEPIRRQCSLLILDDKMPFQLPQDSVIDFQFGLYLMWNPYNFTSVHKHIADLGGVSNAILPVSVQSTPRPAYDHPNAYKTNLFQFVFFSKQTGNHVSYLQNLAKGGSEFTLPIIVPALQSKEIINKTGPHQLGLALPINFWMEYYKVCFKLLVYILLILSGNIIKIKRSPYFSV